MQKTNIQRKLHQYIDEGDDKLLKMLYAIATEYNDDQDAHYEFTEEELKLFEQRRVNRLNAKSKTFTWQEAKSILTAQK